MILSPEEKERRKQERYLENYNKTHKEVDGILYKRCNKHNEYFPEEDEWFPCNEDYFYKNKCNSVDELHPYCKKCTKIKSSKWSKENPDRIAIAVKKSNSKPEIKAMKKEYYKAEKYKIYTREWQQNNPDKIKQYQTKREQNKTHEINKAEWEACNDYFNNCCAYCGLPLEQHIIKYKGEYRQGNFHKEHVDHTGANDLSNCVPSCKECNSEKHTYKLEEWYTENNPKFNQDRLDKIYKWLDEDYKQYIIKNKPKRPYIRKNIDESITS